MKLRTLFVCLLVAVLTGPVIATSRIFEDVPTDHPRAREIRWAAQFDPPLFQGYEDGTFKPDETMTVSQIAKVVERLHQTQDWTRGEVAALLYHGYDALHPNAAASTTSTAVATTAEGYKLPPLPTTTTAPSAPPMIATFEVDRNTIVIRAVPAEHIPTGGRAVYDLKYNEAGSPSHSVGLPLTETNGVFEARLGCSLFLYDKVVEVHLTVTSGQTYQVTTVLNHDCPTEPARRRQPFDSNPRLWNSTKTALKAFWNRWDGNYTLRELIDGEQQFRAETGQTNVRSVREQQNVSDLIEWTSENWHYANRRLQNVRSRLEDPSQIQLMEAEPLWVEASQEAETQHMAARTLYMPGLPEPRPHRRPLPE